MDLNRAAVFVRVVETGGFTRAAEAIGVPASSVSRSVAKLEGELGVVLLERTTRHVALTDAGRAFFERARDALVGLDEASDLALDAAREAHGVVRVAIPPDMGAQAGAMFAELALLYPRIRIELTLTTRGEELVGDLVDIAVVMGRLPDSALVARRLGNGISKLYASAGYLERRGVPRKVDDLAQHDTLLMRAHAGTARWDLSGPKGVEKVDVTGRIVADHMGMIYDAARAGLGIALLSSWLGDKSELVPVLPKYSIETPVSLVTNGGRHLPHRVALMRDYLQTALSGRCKEHGG